jgi:2-polyprenyl-6-methoxyphenol hydroxylase-like FAD-dependent oxidoreductase
MSTSLAIMGARTLAGELSKLGKDERSGKALDTYEDKSRPCVEKSQEILYFVPALAHPGTALKRCTLEAW